MIYITGDTHIPSDIGKLSSKRFPVQKHLTDKDYIIICGDFGGVWCGDNEELYWRKWLDNKKFTTLFIDGNHENFDMLSESPEVEFHGSTAHKISDKIYHLMRGQIYSIDGKKIFTFGGASSHDKEFRKEGKTWWKQELPTENEINTAIKNLNEADNTVDIIITHCAPSSVQRMVNPSYDENILTDFLDNLKDNISYSYWFFGHYHKDIKITDKHTCVYEEIIPTE